jgi:RimJ/RimL family protein N-acetyltransferase
MPDETTKRIEFLPLTPERWDDFESLLGESGGDDGCWCMWWRIPRDQWTAQRGDENRRAMKRIVESGEVPGILAYVEGRAGGWCSVAPRQAYPTLNRSRNLKPVDDEAVWSIVCFYVSPAHRGSGLMTAMVAGARDYAVSQGARIVEAYPREPEGLTPPQAYMGIVPSFRGANFVEVARRSPRQPIMRWQH